MLKTRKKEYLERHPAPPATRESHAEQGRPSTAKNKLINENIKKNQTNRLLKPSLRSLIQ